MSPIPRDISPELVLVDPELAAVARALLPEPGWLGRRPERACGPAVRVAGLEADRVAGERRSGWGLTLALTGAAISLTLNGFWLAQALGQGSSPQARAAYIPSPSSDLASSDPLPPRTGALGASSPAPTTAGSSPETTEPTASVARATRAAAHARQQFASPLRSKHRSAEPGVGRNSAGTAVAATVSSLQWKEVPQATYYNVVLWRDGKRILDLWPSSARAVMPTTSVGSEPRARLTPGRYLWFVYPGFGARPARHYGALAASGVLVVRPKGGNEG
jgi:hypothetical protein